MPGRTLVQTADGTAAIETIEVGDYVWAWDERRNDVALKQVLETYQKSIAPYIIKTLRKRKGYKTA